jgi:tripartite-type tricarboxylate transporter receptor subunit TctC
MVRDRETSRHSALPGDGGDDTMAPGRKHKETRMKRLCFALALLLSAIGQTGNALAQNYPSKPIRIVVPFAAGGTVDTLARLIGSKLSDSMGQPVIVENRPGAGGNLGADAVAKAAPDGYTLLLTTNGQAISPALYKTLPYDPVKDLAPVTQLVASQLLLVANPKLPVTSARDLIELAKSKPGTLNYGSTGIGNPLHLTMEMLKHAAGIDIQAVPYKGDAPLNAGLIAGEVQVAIVPLATTRPHAEAGLLRALAVTGAQRSPAMPDTPTVAESALPGFESSSWQSVFAPGGTPPETVLLIQREIAKALKLPDVQERLRSFGNEAVASTPEEFTAKFRDDMAKFARIVQEAKIPKLD